MLTGRLTVMWPELLQQVVLVMTTSSKPVLMFTKPHVVKRPLKTSRPVPLDVGQIKVQRCSFFFIITCVFTLGAHLPVRQSSPAAAAGRDETKRPTMKSPRNLSESFCANAPGLSVWRISAQCQLQETTFPGL